MPKRIAKTAKKPEAKKAAPAKIENVPVGEPWFSRAQFINSCLFEIRIIQHLATKVPADKYDYRPSVGQRSTTELLRYLSVCASMPVLYVRDANWDEAEIIEKESETLDVRKDFAAAMDRQGVQISDIVNSFTDTNLRNRDRQMPWGAPCKMGIGLVDMVLKPLVAYRMQLFLYLKASGRQDLGPIQCWVGVDPKVKK